MTTARLNISFYNSVLVYLISRPEQRERESQPKSVHINGCVGDRSVWSRHAKYCRTSLCDENVNNWPKKRFTRDYTYRYTLLTSTCLLFSLAAGKQLLLPSDAR